MSARYSRDLFLRMWWLIALCTILAGVGASVGGVLFFRVYQASSLLEATVRISQPTVNTSLLANRLLTTEAQLATSDSTLTQVAAQFPSLSASSLKSKVSAVVPGNSLLLQITVQDSDATRAAAIANAISNLLVTEQAAAVKQINTAQEQPIHQEINTTEQQIAQLTQQLNALGNPPSDSQAAAALQAQLAPLEAQLSRDELTLSQIREVEATSTLVLQVTRRAEPPTLPLLSRLVEGSAAGLASGVLLGFLLALGFDLLNWRVRTTKEAQALLNVPLLGEISREAAATARGETTAATYRGLSDICRTLAHSVGYLGIDRPLRTIAIVSPAPTNISKMVASGLALYLASGGRRTLLIDGYLVGGQQSQQFGIPASPGLSDAALDLRGQASPAAPLRYAHQPANIHAPQLLIMPGGTPPPNVERVLASPAMATVLTSLYASEAEIVLIDTPPLLGRLGISTATEAIIRQVDGILLVVDLPVTRKDHLLRVRQICEEAGQHVLGCVVAGGVDVAASSNAASTPMKSVNERAMPTANLTPTEEARQAHYDDVQVARASGPMLMPSASPVMPAMPDTPENAGQAAQRPFVSPGANNAQRQGQRSTGNLDFDREDRNSAQRQTRTDRPGR